MSGRLPGARVGWCRASTLPKPSDNRPATPIPAHPNLHLRGEADGEGAGLQAALGTAAELRELIAEETPAAAAGWGGRV